MTLKKILKEELEKALIHLYEAESHARAAWEDEQTKDDFSYDISDIEDEIHRIFEELEEEEA